MTTAVLEERVAKLEQELAELRTMIRPKLVLKTDDRPIQLRVSEEYWAEREARIQEIEVLKPIDSTEAVSADRDGR